MKKLSISFIVCTMLTATTYSQNQVQKEEVNYKHSIEASLFMISNFFAEPAYAFKYWPVDTKLPEDFAEVEDGAPNYIFEPSLNFGFKF